MGPLTDEGMDAVTTRAIQIQLGSIRCLSRLLKRNWLAIGFLNNRRLHEVEEQVLNILRAVQKVIRDRQKKEEVQDGAPCS